MNLCKSDSEERELGVGPGVNTAMVSETVEVVGIAEAARRLTPNVNSTLCCAGNIPGFPRLSHRDSSVT